MKCNTDTKTFVSKTNTCTSLQRGREINSKGGVNKNLCSKLFLKNIKNIRLILVVNACIHLLSIFLFRETIQSKYKN